MILGRLAGALLLRAALRRPLWAFLFDLERDILLRRSLTPLRGPVGHVGVSHLELPIVKGLGELGELLPESEDGLRYALQGIQLLTDEVALKTGELGIQDVGVLENVRDIRVDSLPLGVPVHRRMSRLDLTDELLDAMIQIVRTLQKRRKAGVRVYGG